MNTNSLADHGVIGALRQTFSHDMKADLARLRVGLTSAAEKAGLLDVSYRTVDSPVGRLLLSATPTGLVRVAFACEDHDDVLASLAETISPRIMLASARFDDVCRQIDEYFQRRRDRFEVQIDFQLVKGFRRTVLGQLVDIPYGQTVSYAELARLSGNAAAVRAAASACSHNPLPVIVPCHRIVRSDGSIGKYLGGVEAKHLLLAMERGS